MKNEAPSYELVDSWKFEAREGHVSDAEGKGDKESGRSKEEEEDIKKELRKEVKEEEGEGEGEGSPEVISDKNAEEEENMDDLGDFDMEQNEEGVGAGIKCPKCNYSRHDASLVINHLKYNHSITNVKGSYPELFSPKVLCPFKKCDYVTYGGGNLVLHMKARHGKSDPRQSHKFAFKFINGSNEEAVTARWSSYGGDAKDAEAAEDRSSESSSTKALKRSASEASLHSETEQPPKKPRICKKLREQLDDDDGYIGTPEDGILYRLVDPVKEQLLETRSAHDDQFYSSRIQSIDPANHTVTVRFEVSLPCFLSFYFLFLLLTANCRAFPWTVGRPTRLTNSIASVRTRKSSPTEPSERMHATTVCSSISLDDFVLGC